MDYDTKPISPVWLLADRLSITEAALLLVDIEPQGSSEFVENWSDGEKPAGYVAARRAIMSAIQNKRVQGGVNWIFEEDMRGQREETDRIDYTQSWVETESLRKWLGERGFQSAFFGFGQDNNTPGYIDPAHVRYAPKLAAAVEAWESFNESERGSGTAKQKLSRWLRLNAARFGLVDEDGKPTESVIGEIAKIANWARTGGAPRLQQESTPDTDEEIPF